MPYCSIEEAWGNSFEKKTEPKKFKKIVPEHDIIDSDLYDNDMFSEYNTSKKSSNTVKKKNFTRSYNRLPEHSGPSTRLPSSDIKQKRLQMKHKNKILEESESLPTYSNMDIPINDYDLELEKEMNDNHIISEYDEESSSTKEPYINFLINENKELKRLVTKIEKAATNNDSIFDLVLFIACGMFIIFFLDTVNKGIRQY